MFVAINTQIPSVSVFHIRMHYNLCFRVPAHNLASLSGRGVPTNKVFQPVPRGNQAAPLNPAPCSRPDVPFSRPAIGRVTGCGIEIHAISLCITCLGNVSAVPIPLHPDPLARVLKCELA